jgi:hypothetical protein
MMRRIYKDRRWRMPGMTDVIAIAVFAEKWKDGEC